MVNFFVRMYISYALFRPNSNCGLCFNGPAWPNKTYFGFLSYLVHKKFCHAINIAHFFMACGVKKIAYIVRKIINNELFWKGNQFYLLPCACHCYLKAICKQFPATALKLPFVPKYHQIWWYICKILKLSVTASWSR